MKVVTLQLASLNDVKRVKAVHVDVHALLNAGILHKTENGRIVFPFERSGSTSCCVPHENHEMKAIDPKKEHFRGDSQLHKRCLVDGSILYMCKAIDGGCL